MYEQLFNVGPYPCLLAEAQGRVTAMNRPALERLDVTDEDVPASLFDLFSDPDGRLARALRRASAGGDWHPVAAEIAVGGLSGLRVQLSLRAAFDGDRPDRPRVLVWLRDESGTALREQADLIRRLNRAVSRQTGLTDRMEAALSRERYLHGELIHRVRNNLAVLAELIRLHLDRLDDPAGRAALQAFELRIRSVALVHDLLDRNQTLEVVNGGELVTELCKLMTRSMMPEGVTLTCHADALTLHNEDATILCLLINELVTHSVKHAFGADGAGRIDLVFRRNGVEKMELRISGDGRGLAPDTPDLSPPDTEGTRIVTALARRIRGDLVQTGSAGMEWTLVFHPRPSNAAAAE